MRRSLKKRRRRKTTPMLRFTPTAWAKLLFLRDYGETEVGGFGICPNDPLLVEDIAVPKQHCNVINVRFNDQSVADLFDRQVDAGLRPEQFARIWIHTHPCDSPEPSGTDEETFKRVFGSSDWALMFILAKGGKSYARLRFNRTPEAEVMLQPRIDYSDEFEGTDFGVWEAEYLNCVEAIDAFSAREDRGPLAVAADDDWFWNSNDLFERSYC